MQVLLNNTCFSMNEIVIYHNKLYLQLFFYKLFLNKFCFIFFFFTQHIVHNKIFIQVVVFFIFWENHYGTEINNNNDDLPKYKILLLGSKGVGKTYILNKLCGTNYKSPSGSNSVSGRITVEKDGKFFKMEFWVPGPHWQDFLSTQENVKFDLILVVIDGCDFYSFDDWCLVHPDGSSSFDKLLKSSIKSLPRIMIGNTCKDPQNKKYEVTLKMVAALKEYFGWTNKKGEHVSLFWGPIEYNQNDLNNLLGFLVDDVISIHLKEDVLVGPPTVNENKLKNLKNFCSSDNKKKEGANSKK